MHDFVLNEFYRLSDIGVKVNRSMLLDITRHALTQYWFRYGGSYQDPFSGQPVNDMVDQKFLQRLCERYNIVSRLQSGNKRKSPAFTEYTERRIAYYLSELSRQFIAGELS